MKGTVVEAGNYGPIVEVQYNGKDYMIINHQTNEVVNTTDKGRVVLKIGDWLFNG